MRVESMRNRAGLCGLAVAVLWMLPPVLHPAEEPAAEPQAAASVKAKGEKGWRPLFDGKSLKNWKLTDFAGQGPVDVEDGLLVVRSGDPLTGITWEGEQLPNVNYEISLEGQRVDGNDFFCGLTFPVKETHCSLILGGWGGGLTGLSSINGFDASENETTGYESFEKGKWYKIRIRVTDAKVEAWLDDKPVVDIDHTEQKIGVRIEMEASKPLGLATFQTIGAFRDFKIRELDVAVP